MYADRADDPADMPADIEVWLAADLMMKAFGAHAGTVASLRADAFFEDGDIEGCALWRLLAETIADLQDGWSAGPLTH